MLYTEKELQDTLKKDVTISKETEKRKIGRAHV